MVKPLIKICGITELNSAQITVQAGANFIGLVFHAPSKRWVDIDTARLIATETKKLGAEPVAVFVEHTAAEMLAICESCNITTVQLHGDIARQQHRLLPVEFRRIYAIPVTAHGDIQTSSTEHLRYCDVARDFLLFDATIAGNGQPFHWQQFHAQVILFKEFQWFLAGGLTADTVQQALQLLQPTGVDVSSGVEKQSGIKDPLLIQQFIQQALAYNLEI